MQAAHHAAGRAGDTVLCEGGRVYPGRAHYISIEGAAEETALVHMGCGPGKVGRWRCAGTGSTFIRLDTSWTSPGVARGDPHGRITVRRVLRLRPECEQPIGGGEAGCPRMYHDGAITGLVLRAGHGAAQRRSPGARGRGRPEEEVAVSLPRRAKKRTRAMTVAPRVGLVGLLGSGNIGNDASLESVLAYLSAEHADATLDFLCSGTDEITARYGVPAAPLHWYSTEIKGTPGIRVLAAKSVKVPLGIIIDAFRTASWVRRHDVVIVPGMGALETTLPLRPWHTPYSMFLVAAFGRLFGTKVALVSVGTNDIRQRFTRRLVTAAAGLAYYRSYRDIFSRDAMRRMGLDTSGDPVYPDLAFALPVPCNATVLAGSVGVGFMDYHGGNDDRLQADELHASYVEKMKSFILWLVDNGHPVRLFTTDVHDERIMREVIADLHDQRPDLDPSQLIAEPVFSVDELMRQTATVDTVVASRFHNVLFALKLAKPALSVGYSAKFGALMAEMGLAEFCQSADSLDVGRLREQFTELESRSAQLRQTVTERSAANALLLNHQFARLSAMLFGTAEPAATATGHQRAHADVLREESL